MLSQSRIHPLSSANTAAGDGARSGERTHPTSLLAIPCSVVGAPSLYNRSALFSLSTTAVCVPSLFALSSIAVDVFKHSRAETLEDRTESSETSSMEATRKKETEAHPLLTPSSFRLLILLAREGESYTDNSDHLQNNCPFEFVRRFHPVRILKEK